VLELEESPLLPDAAEPPVKPRSLPLSVAEEVVEDWRGARAGETGDGIGEAEARDARRVSRAEVSAKVRILVVMGLISGLQFCRNES